MHSKSWRPWRPVSANFFHFPPKFRLRTWKPSRLNCTNASPSVCRLCFVFNIPTSYIDLLYFDNLLLKTPDLCNLRTFVAIFFVAIYALFPPIFGGKKTDSANLSTFRMYGPNTQDPHSYQLTNPTYQSVHWTGPGTKTLFSGYFQCTTKSFCMPTFEVVWHSVQVFCQ